jgi:membrane protein required for colicin V production
MSYFDIGFLLVTVWSGYRGFSKGFVKTFAALAALVLGVWGAIEFSDLVSGWLSEKTENSKYIPVIAFAITFILIIIVIQLLASFLNKVIKTAQLDFLNKILGALFGVARAALILGILCAVMHWADTNYQLLPEEQKNKSVLYEPMVTISTDVFPFLNCSSADTDFEINIEPAEEEKNTEKPDSTTTGERKLTREEIKQMRKNNRQDNE